MLKNLLILGAGISMFTAPAAAQGLMGATVDLTTRYPNATAVYSDPFTSVVVSDGVEYPLGSFPTYNPNFSVDVAANSLTITNLVGTNFGDTAFNGFALSVLSGPSILSASVNPSSAFSPINVFVQNGTLFANFAGVSTTGGSSVINFTTSRDVAAAVPEPGTWAMMLLGFGAIGASMRRRRQMGAAIAQLA
ncbi:PEPxxWA-CTERM sorting domain-containing protein [Sphingomonas glaciei]|uniref:PEPxxWA-CTERM sorting domain-containing protein n=1 Tax=Sphingomonas glaciei TaxID=2938948 RepID=A0ABY5MVG1_9SPHN|nr:PEPxxWA-CTERM sorting domain-containing protein [Sphingomonas glaciei]UUR07740.1 PEPxxWA-CTERM sorting domain-containing protein [Sphingomonas glaciei]